MPSIFTFLLADSTFDPNAPVTSDRMWLLLCPSEKDSNSCRDCFRIFLIYFVIGFFLCPLFCLALFCWNCLLSLWINDLSLDTKRIHCLFPISLRRIFLFLFLFPFSSFVLLILHPCHWSKRKVGNALPTHVENVTSTLAWHQCLSISLSLCLSEGNQKVGGLFIIVWFPFGIVCSTFILYIFSIWNLPLLSCFSVQYTALPTGPSLVCVYFFLIFFSVECISCLCRISFCLWWNGNCTCHMIWSLFLFLLDTQGLLLKWG